MSTGREYKPPVSETPLRDAIKKRDVAAVVKHFDARWLREQWEAALDDDDRRLILDWTKREVLPRQTNGLDLPVGRGSLVCVDPSCARFQARWTWPAPRFADRCVLGIYLPPPGSAEKFSSLQQLVDDLCKRLEAHKDKPVEEYKQLKDLGLLARYEIDRPQWESAGGFWEIEARPEWRGAAAIVWAKVDLGAGGVWVSEPLALGQLEWAAPPLPWWRRALAYLAPHHALRYLWRALAHLGSKFRPHGPIA